MTRAPAELPLSILVRSTFQAEWGFIYGKRKGMYNIAIKEKKEKKTW